MGTAHYYLLYDEDCSLCRWYTKTFVRFGFLQADARLPYHKGVKDARFCVNSEKAKSEIALVSEGEETRYGVDSLLFVIGRRLPWIEKIGNVFPIYWLLRILYSFLSLNRKVIVPVTCSTECQCDPALNRFWRVAYLLVGAAITALIVGTYFEAHLADKLRWHVPGLDFLLFFMQIGFQYIFFRLLKQNNFWDYAGHIATVSIIGALLLGFLHLGLSFLATIGVEIHLLEQTSFGLVLGVMLLEHARRVRLKGYSKWLSVTWFGFRLLIYPLVFIF